MQFDTKELYDPYLTFVHDKLFNLKHKSHRGEEEQTLHACFYLKSFCLLANRPLFLKTKILKNPTIMTATPIDAVSGDGAVRRIAIPIIIVIRLEE
jgi:hypothetical protein